MEEEVKDAILTEECDDAALSILLEVTIASITSGRPLFPSPLTEPVLYRKFHKWVVEGIEERRALNEKTLGNQAQPPA